MVIPMTFAPLCKRFLLMVVFTMVTLTVQAEQTRLAVAAVGGLSLCGTWPRLVEKLNKKLGIEIETVASGPKEVIVPAFSSGQADLMLIHGSDASFALLASGSAAPLRAWAMNEHVIVGPPEDPAHAKEAPNGLEAMRRIAATGSPFLAFRDPGSHGVVQALWQEAGIHPGPWVLPDTTEKPQAILALAAQKRAYVVVGNIPVAFNKIPHDDLVVLQAGDPAMRRLYVVVEPGPQHPASPEKRAAAKRLADYLVSPAGQADLVEADLAAGGPWIYPLPMDNTAQATTVTGKEVDRAKK